MRVRLPSSAYKGIHVKAHKQAAIKTKGAVIRHWYVDIFSVLDIDFPYLFVLACSVYI